MPLIDGKYVTPAWKDGVTPPGLDAAELTAIGQTLEKSQAGVESAQGMLTNLGNIHVWKKTVVVKPAGYSIGDVERVCLVSSTSNIQYSRWYYSDEIKLDKLTGSVNTENASLTSTFSYDGYNSGEAAKLVGKFGQTNGSVGNNTPEDFRYSVYYFPPGGTVTRAYEGSNYNVYLNGQKVTGWPDILDVTYLTSTDRHAYPDDGEYDGAEYEYQGEIGGKSRFQLLTYAGTGTSGINAPCSATFDFAPDMVAMLCYVDNNNAPYISMEPLFGANSTGGAVCFVMYPKKMFETFTSKNGFSVYGNIGSSFGKVSSDRKTIYWYANNSNQQGNDSGRSFTLLAATFDETKEG